MRKNKTCLGCKVEKSFDDFYNRPVSKQWPDGKRSRCKKCENAEGRKWAENNKDKNAKQSAEWRKKNPEKAKEIDKKYRLANSEKMSQRNKKWREENREYVIEFQRKWREENKEYTKEQSRLRLYGLTPQRYSMLGESQKWLCAICGIHISIAKRGLFVDHSHTTKKVRGLLCVNCNLMIGYAKDSKLILEKAIRYLKV